MKKRSTSTNQHLEDKAHIPWMGKSFSDINCRYNLKLKNKNTDIREALKECAEKLSPLFVYDSSGELLRAAVLYGMTVESAYSLLDKLKAKYGWNTAMFTRWIDKHGFLYVKDAGSVLLPDGELVDL